MFFMYPVAPVFHQDLGGSSSAALLAESYWILYYPLYFLENSPNQQAVSAHFVGAFSVVSNLSLQEKRKKHIAGMILWHMA